MDENTGTILNDSSGYNTSLSFTNNPQWAVGKFGSGLLFNGTSNYVTGTPPTTILDNVSSLSASVWIKPNSVGGGGLGPIIVKSNGPGTGYWVLRTTNNNAVQFVAGFSTEMNHTTSDNAITYGQWNHVEVTWDGTGTAANAHIYVNGVETTYQTTTDAGGARVSDAGTIALGNTATYYFDGVMDDVRIYNYMRSPKQIIADMNAGHASTSTPLAWWKFDEGHDTPHNSGSLGSSLDGTNWNMDDPPTYGSGWTNKGKFGKALNFDGINDFVQTSASTFVSGSPGLTVSAWFNYNAIDINGTMIVSQGTFGCAANSTFQLRLNSPTQFTWNVCDGTNDTDWDVDVPSMAQNTWYHVVATWNGPLADIYINGVKAGETTTSITSLYTGSLPVYIGSNAGGDTFFNGTIDEVKVYNYALSADEVKVEYNHGAVVLGSLSTDVDGTTASNSAERAYCPPGNTEGNCATGLNPAPIAHWALDEGTGTKAEDDSGNNYGGTLTNGPQWVVGKFGQALNFDGASQYVTVGAGQDLTGDWTVSAWVNTSGLIANGDDVNIILERGGNSPLYERNYELGITPSTGKGYVNTSVDSYKKAAGATTITAGKWYYLTGTFNSATKTLTLYVNGAIDGSTTISALPPTTSQTIAIGASNPSPIADFFPGIIDDVRVYNYARTQSQIDWDFNRGKPVAQYKFDDCQGATAYDSGPKADPGISRYDQPITAGNATIGNCTKAGSMWGGTNGDITTNAGKFNYALTLNSAGTENDYASTSGTVINAVSQTTYSALSWGGWLNASSSGVASKALIEKNREFRLTTDASSKPSCSIWTAGNWSTAATSSNPLSLSSWQHILCTYDGSNIKVFINGVKTGSTSQTASIMSLNYTPLTTGHDFGGSTYYSGQIDDERLYNYALTSTQIQTLFNEDSAVRFGPLTGSP
jgi:hypothetical protein